MEYPAWVAGFGITIFGLFQIFFDRGSPGHGHRPLIMSVILSSAFWCVVSELPRIL